MRKDKIDKKLEELREKYKKAQNDNDRKIITVQAKLLKMSLEKYV